MLGLLVHTCQQRGRVLQRERILLRCELGEVMLRHISTWHRQGDDEALLGSRLATTLVYTTCEVLYKMDAVLIVMDEVE